MRSMTRVEAIPYDAMKAGLPWDWVTFPEFLDRARSPAQVGQPAARSCRVGPLLVWVLGLERAKAGAMPTDAEHAEMRRLLHEAMDAGAGGWSAQRLEPGSGADVQRDYDGTPMVTDVMHDETCFELAEVLAERNEGFIQLTARRRPTARRSIISRSIAADERPADPVERGPPLRPQSRHASAASSTWLAPLPRARAARSTARASPPTPASRSRSTSGTCSTKSTLLARGDDGHASRSGWRKLADPARRPGAAAEPPVDRARRRSRRSSSPRRSARRRAPFEQRDHRRHRRAAAARTRSTRCSTSPSPTGSARTFFSLPANASLDGFRDLMLDPVDHPRRLRRRRAHALPHRGPLPDRDDHPRRARQRDPLARGRALEALDPAGVLRRLRRPRHARGGQGRRHRRLRLRAPRHDAGREGVRLSRQASGAACSAAIGYRYVLVNGEVTIEDDRPTGAPAGRLLRSQARKR